MRVELEVSPGVELMRPGLAVKVAVELDLLSSPKRLDLCDGGGSASFQKKNNIQNK